MVYFISAKALGLIKIGYAKSSVEKRLRELQALSPTRLTLVGQIPGDRRREAELHKAYRKYRSHGEWFFASNELNYGIEILSPLEPSEPVALPKVQVTAIQPKATIAKSLSGGSTGELTVWLTNEPQYVAHLNRLRWGYQTGNTEILDKGFRLMAMSIGYPQPPLLPEWFLEKHSGKPQNPMAGGNRIAIPYPKAWMDWILEFAVNSSCEVSIVCRLALAVAGEEIGIPRHDLSAIDEEFKHLLGCKD
jgi:hypothetical protein